MSAPVPQEPRFGGIRPAAVSMVSGSAVVTALTLANAPWEVVIVAVLATLVVSLVLGLAKIVLPMSPSTSGTSYSNTSATASGGPNSVSAGLSCVDADGGRGKA